MDLDAASGSETVGGARFCIYCGAARAPGSRFCISCGEAFQDDTDSRPPTMGSPAPTLVDLAADPDEAVRTEATKRIIEAVDVEAMTRCGVAALDRGDVGQAEFWFLEVATADADEIVRADGIEGLSRNVLIPAGRFEEAELYSRHAARYADAARRSRALRTLADIEEGRATRDVRRLEYTTAWREVDVSEPLPPGLTQQQQYVRMLAHLFYRDENGLFDELNRLLAEDFMPNVTGLIIGLSRSSASHGMERETAVKAVADWLDHR